VTSLELSPAHWMQINCMLLMLSDLSDFCGYSTQNSI